MRNEPPTHPDEPGVQSHLAESSLPKPMEDKPPQSQVSSSGWSTCAHSSPGSSGWDPDVPEGIPADLGDIDDEGFGDEAEKQDNTISPLSLVSTKEAICLSRNSPSPSQSSQDLPPEPQEDVCRGPEGAPGFDRVVDLARYLVELREKPCIPDREAAEIVRLFKATHFKTSTCHGKESLKQCVLGQGSGPAQWPNISRTVEAVCLELCFIHPAGKVKWGVSMNCWAAIIHDYHKKTGGELPSTERTNKNPAF
ncbi:hypothetical protein Q8A67_010362 [Cirrhinus molitorella]|uniref:Uncharacterized protein n=1 Tax=Cirrhinus molitorella TaxID=172907 RepID=A0AA88PWT9_9TELE|nr:hypothetical protein Q8A67_010362 [Cirrhinus molitorella]